MKRSIIGELNALTVITNFFLAVAAVYGLHAVSGGAVFLSRLYTCGIFSVFWILFSLAFWPWMKFSFPRGSNRERLWITAAVPAVLLLASLWAGQDTLPGDYSTHKEFALQLLNGQVRGHFFYRDALGFYPPLTHAVMATVAQFTMLSMHHTMCLVSLFTAFMVPLFTYRLARSLGLSLFSSLFFTGLISLYGGCFIFSWRMFHLYLPSIQLFITSVARNMSLLLFIIFLNVCVRDITESPGFLRSLHAGLLIGLMGLTHPQGFIMGVLFQIITSLFSLKQAQKKQVLLFGSLSLIVGSVITALSSVPTLIALIRSGGLIQDAGIMMDEIWPASIWLYGVLPLLAVCVLLNKGSWKRWMVPALLTMAAPPVIRIVSGLFISTDRWYVLRIHRFGPYLFIFLALFAAAGSSVLIDKIKRIRYLVTAVMICIVLVGFWTSYRYINRWRKIIVIEVVKDIRHGRLYPHMNVERLRLHIPDTRGVLMVQPDIARIVAFETGIDVPYVENPRIFTKDFFERTITQDRRLQLVEDFYEGLQEDTLRLEILKTFDSNAFLSRYPGLHKLHPGLRKAHSVRIKERKYHLYVCDQLK